MQVNDSYRHKSMLKRRSPKRQFAAEGISVRLVSSLTAAKPLSHWGPSSRQRVPRSRARAGADPRPVRVGVRVILSQAVVGTVRCRPGRCERVLHVSAQRDRRHLSERRATPGVASRCSRARVRSIRNNGPAGRIPLPMPRSKKPKATGQAADVTPIAAPSPPPQTPSPAGRPTKLTPDTEHRFLSYIRAGAFAWVAAESAGIGQATFYRWMEQGEADEAADRQTLFREFREKVRQARTAAAVPCRLDDRARGRVERRGRPELG